MNADLDLRDLHRSHEPDPAFAAALEQRLEAMLANTAPTGERAAADVDPVPVVLDPTQPHRTMSRVVLATAAAVVLVAAVGFVAWRGREPGNVATDPGGPTSIAAPTTINVPKPPPAPPFIGVWASTDTDGSSQTMEIASTEADQYEVVVNDDRATACSDAPSTMTGSARVGSDHTLVVAQPELTCDDGTTPVIGPPPQPDIADFTYTYDPVSDQLVDGFGVVWGRGGAPEDLPIGVDTSALLGSWETSGLGEGWQRMDIAASADGSLLLTIRDDAAAVCGGGASTTAGVGRYATGGELRAVDVVVTAPQLTCDDASTPLDITPPIDEQPRDFRLFYAESSDELGQIVANNVWFWARAVDEEPTPAAAPYQPESTGDLPAGWVAFVAAEGTAEHVYVVRSGVQPRRVDVAGSDVRTETCPAFAPGGEQLVFGRARPIDLAGDAQDGFIDAELVVVHVGDDGSASAPRTIPVNGLDALPCPIWAPDGRWVAFGGAGAVWAVDTQTGETRRIADHDPTDLEWRPGSDELAITGTSATSREADTPIDLYSVGTGTTRTLGDVRAAHLSWSPDGNTLAFRHGEDETDSGIWLVDSDGQHVRKLSHGGTPAVHGVDIVWSPRGDLIAFQRRRGCCEASDVVLVTATEDDPDRPIGTQRVVTPPVDGGDDWLPFSVTWSADGSHLLYVAWVWDGEGDEVQGVVAVPIEADQSPSVLAIADVSVHGGTPWIPIEQWQPVADQ